MLYPKPYHQIQACVRDPRTLCAACKHADEAKIQTKSTAGAEHLINSYKWPAVEPTPLGGCDWLHQGVQNKQNKHEIMLLMESVL